MSRSKLLKFGLPPIACIVLCYFFPLWHIRSLDTSTSETGRPGGTGKSQSAGADPATYVDTFWNSDLRKGDRATEVTQLWKAFDTDANQAKRDLGRKVGLGGSSYFCVRGSGKIETVEMDRCTISVPGDSRQACLLLGVIVDNTIRNAIGINVNEFSNSQDFNTISSELNLRVEQEVVNTNKDLLKPGRNVEFVGCGKIGEISDLDPLCLVPIRIDVADREASQ